jgi:hypothetical protein
MSEKMRRAWKELVLQIKPEIAVTLGAGLPTTTDRLNKDAVRFLNKVQRRAYGPRWAKITLDQPIEAIGFHELIDGNHHMHLAAAGPYEFRERLMLDGRRLWKATRVAGDYWDDVIDRADGYAGYITKAARSQTSIESVFVYRRGVWRKL